MSKNSSIPPAEELSRAISELLATGPVEVHEDGELLAELSGFRYEIREERNATFIFLWSEERNLARRIVGVNRKTEGHLIFEVQRFRKPGCIEFLASSRVRAPQRLSREKFRARFKRLLADQFPDEEVERLTSAPDLEHSFSGSYTRGVMHRGQRAWAVLGVSAAEDRQTIDDILSFGLLWLDWTRGHAGRRAAGGLRLFLPDETAAPTAHRLRVLSEWVHVELYAVNESRGRVRKLDPRDVGNIETRLTPHREVLEIRAAAREVIERITALAPDSVDTVVRPTASGREREIVFRFRGLDFARWQSGRLSCLAPEEEMPEVWIELSGPGAAQLQALVKRLNLHRNSLASDTSHPLYRAVAERWLESLVLQDITRLNAKLDPAHTYPQVPAFSGSMRGTTGAGRGVIDVLGVTRDGRLVVVELKASEDIHLALQGADYWLRVRLHQKQGDFARYGYFSGIELQQAPPILCLVAPGLRIHPATEILLKYLSPEIQVVRIGLNEDWRRELRVVFRQ